LIRNKWFSRNRPDAAGAKGRFGSFASFPRWMREVRFGLIPAVTTDIADWPKSADTVAKVVLHWGSEILRAAGATFV
jgi:hypothetical protein